MAPIQVGFPYARRRRSPAGRQRGAWHAEAHGAGAQPGGRGAALRGSPRGSLTRPPARPAAPRQAGPLFAAASRQPSAVCKHSCTSPRAGSAMPPPARRPWRRSAQGPSPRSRWKDKRAAGPPRSTKPRPPAGQIPEAKLRRRAPLLEEWGWGRALEGRGGGRLEGVQRPRWRCPRPGSRPSVLAGSGGGGRRGGRRAPLLRGARVTVLRESACRPSGLPDTPQLRCRHLMAKVAPNRHRHGAPRADAAPQQPPTSRSSLSSSSKCRNFSQTPAPVPRGHRGSPPADVAPPPASGRCT